MAHSARPAAAPDARLRVLVPAGFFLSGLAGLVCQVVWSRALALFIGGTTLAVTLVLAAFMGGLALGNHVFGRRADRTAQPLRLYASLELGVGLVCLFFPELLALLSEAYFTLAAPLGPGAPGTTALKLGFAALAILPATFLMGGTLPVLARFLVRNLDDVTASIGRLYFVNSFGAALGAALAGFLLIPAAGLELTLRLSGALNLALAAAFFWAGRDVGGTPGPAAPPEPTLATPAYPLATRRLVLAVIGLSGAVSMVYEVVWTRLLALVMGSSTYSFTIVVMTFISGITLGSLAVSRRFGPGGQGGDPLRWLAFAELGVFAACLPVYPVYDRLPFTFASIASVLERTPDAFPYYIALQVAIAFGLLFLPTFFIGMTLPLASRIAVDAMPILGRRVGSVFSINTLGTVLGAMLAGLVLLPALSLETALTVGIAASGVLGAALLLATDLPRRLRLGVPAAVTVAFALVVLATPGWDKVVLNFGVFRTGGFERDSHDELVADLARFELVEATDGSDTSVAVLRDRRTDRLYLKVNGKTDAGTGEDMTTQLWLGHLGPMLHRDARRVLVIGLGSGITAGAALAHRQATVDVVEISRAVVDAARHFEPHNGGVLTDPRTTLHIADAKEVFKLEPNRRWDVVVSEPSNPWISGIGNLFSLEYFRDIKTHLEDDGLLVQWVHLYELDDRLLRVILNTVAAVFPHVELWQCNTEDVLVVASRSPIRFDAERIRERLARPEIDADLNRPHLSQSFREPADVALLQVLSDTRFRRYFPGEEPHNTDVRPLLEFEAPRAFFAKQKARLAWRLDERRLPREVSRTHLAAMLRQTPLAATTMARLRATLSARGGRPDRMLLRSLAWAYQAASPHARVTRELFASHGDEGLLSVLNGQIPAIPTLAEAELVRQATSVFFRPAARTLPSRAGAAALDPDGHARVLSALSRLADAADLEAWPLGDAAPAVIRDPARLVSGPMALGAYRDLLAGLAWLDLGEPACAVTPLERFAAVHPDLFPGPQALAAARREAPPGASCAR